MGETLWRYSVPVKQLRITATSGPHLSGSALFVSHEMGGQADGAFELWQTECLYGTVFALRVLLVRMQQARRETQAGQSSSCR